MTRPPFPKTIDSTMLKTFRECPIKMKMEYMDHWKTKSISVHLHAGKAFASALETVRVCFYEKGLPSDEALEQGVKVLIQEYGTFECPPDESKSLDRMIGALDHYFTRWPLDTDPVRPWQWATGKHAIEFTFAAPLPFLNPETGEPVIYTGRSDFIGEMNGALYIVDDKTTKQLGASWMHAWDLRSQFTGYTWAARSVADIPVQGVMVRGVSILKTKYDNAEVITYRPQWQVDRWLDQSVRDLQRLQQCWESGWFDYNLDEACNSYGGCAFRRVCLSPEPQAWLESDFERRVWDPLARTETKID